MSVDPEDFIEREVLSDCCGAPMMSGGMCSECREHAAGEVECRSCCGSGVWAIPNKFGEPGEEQQCERCSGKGCVRVE